MRIVIQRRHTTEDGIFGNLLVIPDEVYQVAEEPYCAAETLFECTTVENKMLAIPAGVYRWRLEKSNHFRMLTPHLGEYRNGEWVDSIAGCREYIEIHPANRPDQLRGCIATGLAEDGDALDNSRVVFMSLMNTLASAVEGDIEVLDPVPGIVYSS